MSEIEMTVNMVLGACRVVVLYSEKDSQVKHILDR